MPKSPVAFFGFNRPDCTKIVFEAIRRYHPEQLFLVADGPRSAVPADAVRCEAVREIMRSVDWDCEVHTDFAEQNLGCKKRMSSGIDWVFSKVEEAILLEDDCVPAPDFFEFCSAMLAHYRDDPRIMHVSGANFQAGQSRGDASYYFSSFIHIWGWASWRRAWRHYDVEMQSWPEAKEENWISREFSTPLEREYWSEVFERVYTGGLDTWDYQWAYACRRRNGVGIIPNVNLITNVGAGPDATHTKGEVGSLAVPTGKLGSLHHPRTIAVDQAADKFTFDIHCGGSRMRSENNPFARIQRRLSRLKRFMKKVGAR